MARAMDAMTFVGAVFVWVRVSLGRFLFESVLFWAGCFGLVFVRAVFSVWAEGGPDNNRPNKPGTFVLQFLLVVVFCCSFYSLLDPPPFAGGHFTGEGRRRRVPLKTHT